VELESGFLGCNYNGSQKFRLFSVEIQRVEINGNYAMVVLAGGDWPVHGQSEIAFETCRI
jgi:hypothetical protein